MKKISFRDVRIDDVCAEEMTDDIVAAAISGDTMTISFVNPHSFHILTHIEDTGIFARSLGQLDRIAADGVGVTSACRLLRLGRLPRYGFDMLAPVLLPRVAEKRIGVYLFGGRDGVAERAAEVLRACYPGLRIVGTHSGYIDGDLGGVASDIRETCARVVCIGTGAPRQEEWAVALSAMVPNVVYVTCGGFFDQVHHPEPFFPAWSHRLGLNWLVRLTREPRRVWRRIFLEAPRFVLDTLLWIATGGRERDAVLPIRGVGEDSRPTRVEQAEPTGERVAASRR